MVILHVVRVANMSYIIMIIPVFMIIHIIIVILYGYIWIFGYLDEDDGHPTCGPGCQHI